MLVCFDWLRGERWSGKWLDLFGVHRKVLPRPSPALAHQWLELRSDEAPSTSLRNPWALRLLRDHIIRGDWHRSACRCGGRQVLTTLSTWLLPARVERLNPRVV